jgi:small-conductance mechanosensitive channel
MMAVSGSGRPVSILIRDLLIAFVVGAALYAFFQLVNERVLVIYAVAGPVVLLLEAGAILLVAYLFARALAGTANAIMRRRGDLSRGAVVRIFINLLVAAGAVLALFSLAGVSIENIFLGSALAGIVLGLAAQTVLANLFAGILLIAADPFRPGDRINIVSGGLGAMAPSYAHEMMYPLYGGTVEDVGLTYTILRQDTGGIVKVPNSLVLNGIVQHPEAGMRTVRVRMTFPQTIPVATVESAISDLRPIFQDPKVVGARVSFEVADISATTWDALVIVVTPNLSESSVRDRILRAVLVRTTGPTPTTIASPGKVSA